MPVPKGISTTTTEQDQPRLKKDVQLAINVFDLGRMNPYVRQRVIKGSSGARIDLSKCFEFDKEDPTERFAVFTCPLLEAALVIDMVRSEGRRELTGSCRAYVKKGDGDWKKVGYDVVLTEREGDTFVLSERVFPVEVELAPIRQKPAINFLDKYKRKT